ncbi:MAG: hypothetical protein CMM00_16145 [Rhodopirellula sp.]|nr:hypothetical protein [Rhodopirellula sp.]
MSGGGQKENSQILAHKVTSPSPGSDGSSDPTGERDSWVLDDRLLLLRCSGAVSIKNDALNEQESWVDCAMLRKCNACVFGETVSAK